MRFITMFRQIFKKLRYFARKFKPIYQKSYSQCGEDMIARFYLHQEKGFYVDVGAYHPKILSNTYHFYLKGWNGINIDGSKDSISLFNSIRPDDININCCIGLDNNHSEIDFYMFERAELNTFKKENLSDIKLYHNQSPVKIEKIPIVTLESILNNYLPSNKQIDLFSIDAEGADEEILFSNNWVKYRPKLIIVEKHCSIYDFIKTEMHQFLINQNYILAGYSRHSYIFQEIEYSEL
jgi:hypothetical protein